MRRVYYRVRLVPPSPPSVGAQLGPRVFAVHSGKELAVPICYVSALWAAAARGGKLRVFLFDSPPRLTPKRRVGEQVIRTTKAVLRVVA